MRRCLILRQGASPLRPPAPFSLEPRLYARERICQGFATPAQNAALDRFAPLRRKAPEMRERGPLERGSILPPFGRQRAADPYATEPARPLARHEALPHTPPGGKPPETPNSYGGFPLTEAGLLMEAATVRERVLPRAARGPASRPPVSLY